MGVALLWRALATTALDEDGPGLIWLLASARGGFVAWYHAAYLLLGMLAERFVGMGHALSALLWVSAVAGGLGLWLLGRAQVACLPASRVSLAWIACACVFASPALWVNATRVEVHAVQLLGAATVLLAAVRAPSYSPGRGRVMVCFAALFAVTCHNSNLLCLPGAAWIAAQDPRRSASVGRGWWRWAPWFLLGGLGGLLLDQLLPGESARGEGLAGGELEGLAALEGPWQLLSRFAQGFSPSFVWEELVLGWFPVLFLALAAAAYRPRAWRQALPFLGAGLPSLLLFAIAGIRTAGGYFVTSMACLACAAAIALAAASDRLGPLGLASRAEGLPATATGQLETAGRLPKLLLGSLLVVVAIGLLRSWNRMHEPLRLARESLGAARLQLAKAALPSGGLLIALDPEFQAVNGREPGLFELPALQSLIVVSALGGQPDDLIPMLEPELVRQRERGEPVAYWRAPLDPAQLGGGDFASRCQELIEQLLARHFELEAVELAGQPFLIGTPREQP